MTHASARKLPAVMAQVRTQSDFQKVHAFLAALKANVSMTKMQRDRREECFKCQSSDLLGCFKTICVGRPTKVTEGCNTGYQLQMEVAMAFMEIWKQKEKE